MRPVTRLLLPLVFVVLAQPLARGAEDTFSKILPSSVWVTVSRGQQTGVGTGCLIDRERKLVLTCLHVVGSDREAIVYFPTKDRNGLVTSAVDYVRRGAGIAGHVVATDADRDLALLKLDRVPDGVAAVPLADGPPAVGKKVFAVGNATREAKTVDAAKLWRQYSSKIARGVFSRQTLDGKQQVRAWALVLEDLVFQGDSGGPLVDADGRLVGVVFAEDKKNGFAIDADEVRIFLERHRAATERPLTGRWNVEFVTKDKESKLFRMDLRDGGNLEWIMDKKHPGQFELNADKLKLRVPSLSVDETVTIKRADENRFTFISGGIEFTATRR